MCSSVEPDIEESSEQYISPHYQNFVNLKGMKGVHQNIQSLQAKIDLTAVNRPQNIRAHGVISSHLSDHDLVYCVRKLDWIRAPRLTQTFRNYANYSKSEFFAKNERCYWNSDSSNLKGDLLDINDF